MLPSPAAYGRVVGGRHLALLDNEGNALLWDLAQGSEISRTKLPAYPDLVGLNVIMLGWNHGAVAEEEEQSQDGLPDAPQLQTSDGKFHVDGAWRARDFAGRWFGAIGASNLSGRGAAH